MWMWANFNIEICSQKSLLWIGLGLIWPFKVSAHIGTDCDVIHVVWIVNIYMYY